MIAGSNFSCYDKFINVRFSVCSHVELRKETNMLGKKLFLFSLLSLECCQLLYLAAESVEGEYATLFLIAYFIGLVGIVLWKENGSSDGSKEE